MPRRSAAGNLTALEGRVLTVVRSSFEPPIPLLADRLRSLPRRGLRRALVLVASQRYAHALRRYVCVERGRPGDLAGVRLLRPVDLAQEVLLSAGRVRTPGGETLRRLRIFALFQARTLAPRLRYFDPDQLGGGRGYANAFARAIADLEAGGLDASFAAVIADELGRDDRLVGDRLHDVAVTWGAAEVAAGDHRTCAQLLIEAAGVLTARPQLLAASGPAFAILSGSPDTALLRFLHSVPGCEALLHDARPLRQQTQRWRALVGLPAELPLRPPLAVAADTELTLVRRLVFELPETLTDPRRPRSAGPDGSVDLEEHASLEEEVEAAVGWIAEQIAADTPVEQIAVIVPELDPYAGRLVDRLARVADNTTTPALRCHVVGGVPLIASPAGLRLEALLRALDTALDAVVTVRLLPQLRRPGQSNEDRRDWLSPSRAAGLVYGAGIVGGSPGDPQGLREWVPRLSRWKATLQDLVGALASIEEKPVRRRDTVDRQQTMRRLKEVEGILPAVAGLQALGEQLLDGAPIPAVWQQLRRFVERWLILPDDSADVLDRVQSALEPVVRDPLAVTIAGFAAIAVVRDTLMRLRLGMGRFGEPAVFVGTPADAAGLNFSAVRLVGLAEGVLPHTPHDDAIVPDAVRPRIERLAQASRPDVMLPGLADQVLGELHAAFRVIAGCVQRLALSAPRQWVDRSEREVSGLMLEVATALGRPGHPQAGEGDVPTVSRLRAAYLRSGRNARLARAMAVPVTPRSALTFGPRWEADRIVVPGGWLSGEACAIDRVHRLLAVAQSAAWSTMDGAVADVWPLVGPPPGLSPERPVSASGLAVLLRCPHRFLLERTLHLSPPPTRPATDAIDAVAYGTLFHGVAERFLAEAGVALCRHDATLAHWLGRAEVTGAERFDAFVRAYPLRGDEARMRERQRLLTQVEGLVRDEWRRPAREYVASELRFGDPTAVGLRLAGGDLYVWGSVDRVDRIGGAQRPGGGLSVRDFKTGYVPDLGDEPSNVTRDLQLGLYTLALENGGHVGEAAVVEAAYVYLAPGHERERLFTGPHLEHLRGRTRHWMEVARQLLSAGAFPRSPNPADCGTCPFAAVCGDGAQHRSAEKLRALPLGHDLAAFIRLKHEGGNGWG